IGELERAGGSGKHQYAEEESNVSEPGDHKGFLGCIGGGTLLPPESNKKIGADSDKLPAIVKREEVVGHNRPEHGGGEERKIGEVPRVPGLDLHVADGVDLHQRADSEDDQYQR